MDDTVALPPLIDDLSANIEDLTSALAPLLNTPLSTRASSLPLLDKAKLHIHTAYAIESLLFSALQVSGQNAKEHPIFAELGRLKSYFKKVKDAELGSVPRSRIDKEAVGRFIKHGLAGNDRYDKEREERVLKEK
ncbi:Sas10/Utp3/C1D family-domain-containing protein, partial [Clohesyomyces aquaticus]